MIAWYRPSVTLADETPTPAKAAKAAKAAGPIETSPPAKTAKVAKAVEPGAAPLSEEVAARAAALLRFAEAAHAALAAREPDPIEEAERAAIQAEPLPPAPGSPERARLDAEHRAMLRGLLDAAMVRPAAWSDVAARPPPGSHCYCCRGRRWWRERVNPTGWRCWTCHGPWHLTAADVVEVRT